MKNEEFFCKREESRARSSYAEVKPAIDEVNEELRIKNEH